jgi:hypothetical protein
LADDVHKHSTTAGPATAAEVADCDIAAVKRRAKAGLVTIMVAVTVAVLTLAGAAATLLVTGIVPLSGLEGRISAAIEERLGNGWTVEAAAAELGRIDGHSQLRVRQVSFRHSSGATIRAPEAVLGYEPLALLMGEIKLVSVDLRGVNVRLGVNKDGALVVNADSAPAETPPAATLPDTAQWNAFTGIMGAVTTLAQGDGFLGSLETAGMNGARLSLVAPDGRQKAGFEDVEIKLTRTGERATRLAIKGRTGSRWKELAIDLSRAADGTQRADIDIIRFEPAEVMALALGTGGVALEGLPLKGRAALIQTPDGKKTITAEINVLPGIIRFPDSPLAPFKLDAAHVEIVSTNDLSVLELRAGELQAGATRLKGSGTLREENGAWRLRFDGGGQIAGLDSDPAIVVDSVRTDLLLDPRSNEARIDGIAFRGPVVSADITGRVQKTGPSPTQRLSVKATNSDVRAILALWPRWTSPEVHTAMTRQFAAGQVGNLSVELDLSAEEHARLLQGAGIPDRALAVAFDATQVRFLPSPDLPPLVDGVVSGKGTGRSVQVAIAKAAAEIGNGRQLALSEGSFSVAETWMSRAPARVTFRSTGPVEALAALAAYPALKDFAPATIDPAAIRGTSDLRTVINLPLVDDPKPGEVVVQSTGTLANVASDTLLGTEKLDNGAFSVAFDRNSLQVKGEARISGDRGQIEIKQDGRGKGEATLAFSLDNAARQKRGLGPEFGISGPVQVKVTKALGRGTELPPRVEVDLGKAALDGVLSGLNKAAGKPGRASFTYVADPDGPDLDDFIFEASPVSIRGKIELNKQNGFESASLSQFRLSPGDNLKIEAKRDGNLTKLVIRGAVADVRPFIKELQSASSPPQRGDRSAAKSGDLDVDLDVPILTGFNNEAISNATMKLSKRGGEMSSLSFQGRIGRADVTAKQGRRGDGPGPIMIHSENGGALLRFADLYRRAYGGDLILNMGPGEARQSGELLFRDFLVRDEPALRRVIAQQSSAPSGGADGAGGAGPVAGLNASEVGFTKLKAEFTRSASRLDVSDMVIWGQQVGFTLQGNVDYGRDRVDIGGTFVPGYAFNNAFAQVPIVGALLGGGSQYGGLFAVNFRISGAASAPTMSINPLSAIAPGILRRFVDPLGGAPAQQPLQPRQPVAPAVPPGR